MWKKLLIISWPFLLILTATLIFFYPVWLQNKIPLPADLVVGTYYPWLDYKWGYPTGVPVKNPITTDAVSFMFPMQTYAIDLLKKGKLPLWNDLILSGTPLMANFQSASFSITNIYYFLFDKLTGWSLQVISQIFLAAVFGYLFLRELERSKLAALAGGLFFAFSGFMIIWLEWNGHVQTAAYFPLVILMIIKWVKSRKLIYGLLLSIALTLQIFAGYPQIVLYELLVIPILFFFFIFKSQVQNYFFTGFGLIFFILLGISLTSIQILPSIELINLSQREVERINTEDMFLPWQSLLMLFAPDYFGNHSTYNYWGPSHYTIASGFSGVIGLGLAILGGLSGFRQIGVRLGLSMITLAFLLGLQNPISSLLLNNSFLGLKAASAHRILILVNLGLVILAAYGLDRFLTHKLGLKDILISLLLPLLVLITISLVTVYLLWFGDPKLYFNLKIGLRNLVFPFFWIITSTLIFLLRYKFPKYKLILSVLLITIAILELFRFGWKYTPFSEKKLVYPKTPIIEFLQKELSDDCQFCPNGYPETFRVIASKVIPMNIMMSYGIETVEGYDAVYPFQYGKFLSVINADSTQARALGRYGSVDSVDSQLINLTNARFVLSLKKDSFNQLSSDRYREVFEDKSVVIYENLESLPRALMVYGWEVEKDKTKALEKINNKMFPLKDKIILSDDPQIISQPGRGTVDFKDYLNNKSFIIDTTSAGILLVLNSYYPGWKALVNGREVKIVNADFNFIGVPILESGKSTVKLIYQPDSFRNGVVVTLFSLIVFILIIIFTLNKNQKML